MYKERMSGIARGIWGKERGREKRERGKSEKRERMQREKGKEKRGID